MTTEYLREKRKKRNKFIGYIFILWFICSFVGFFLVDDPYYIAMLFGQYFLVFGLVGFFGSGEKEGRLVTIPFILVGACCLVIPYLMMNPELVSVNIDWDVLIPILLLLCFLLVGLGFMIIPLVRRNYLKKVCNYEMTATIVGYDITRSRKGSTLYCPVYGFWYNGRDWNVSNNFYTNVGLKDVGTSVSLKINPDNPEEFIAQDSKSYLIMVFMGLIIILVILPVLIYFISNNSLIK